MLVPAMTLEEIRKEVLKEFPILQRKAGYVGKEEYKYKKHSKVKDFIKTYDYVSKYKNNWICTVQYTNEQWVTAHLALFNGPKGLAAIAYDSERDMLHYYTAHFFNRYNERLKLNLIKPTDIIRHYHANNNAIGYAKIGDPTAAIYKFLGKGYTGIVLGTVHNHLRLMKMNTFLANDGLTENQSKLSEICSPILNKYMDEAGVL